MSSLPRRNTNALTEEHLPYSKYSALLATVILSALIVFVAATVPGVSADGDDDLPPPPKRVLTYPNLGSLLSGLVEAYEEGSASQSESAGQAAISLGGSVAVTIYLTGNVAEVVGFLEDFGGDPRNVGEDYIEAYVPVWLLGPVSERPGVIRVREIVPPEPTYGAYTSQGARAHGSPDWNRNGYTGKGVKVGVIDSYSSFVGYSALTGTELPAPAGVRCYTSVGLFTNSLADCEGPRGNHGTRVAEIVMDIAPEVSLYIGAPASAGDQQATVDWMISQGVSVIVQSLTWPLDGPGDGTSLSSNSPLNTVDRAVAGGIIWVTGTGNYAHSTWFGDYSDTDSDQFIEFDGFSDETNRVYLNFLTRISVELRWEDSWGGAASNFDISLIDERTGQVVASSQDPQSGVAGQVPHERFGYGVFNTIGWHHLKVSHVGGNEPDWLQIIVKGVGNPLQHGPASYSVSNPGESANDGMLAVGAAQWNNTDTIERYSSQGPTPDGRVKPELVGATCVETSVRGSSFCGTSASAPHVAGLAALVRQRFPDYTPVQVANYLKNNAEQRQSPDPNFTWGHGFAKLPRLSPPPPRPRPRTTPPPVPTPAPPAPTTDPCGQTVTGDGPISGTWVGGCESQVAGRGHARYYTFSLDRDSAVTIDLRSSVDTFLYLRSGDTKSGPAVAENDDHGTLVTTVACADPAGLDQTDSCITIPSLSASTAYTIEATTYAAGETGDFTLTVSGLGGGAGGGPAPPGTDTCTEALTADVAKQGTWAAGCQSETQAPGQGSGARLARYYTFSLDREREVTITVDSAVDSYLYLRAGDNTRSGTALNDHLADDDAGGDRNAQIQQTLVAGAYTIEATTYAAGETGDFTLTVSGLGGGAGGGPAPPGTDTCTEALTADVAKQGTWAAGCQSETQAPGQGSGARLARYYTFSLDREREVTITVDSAVDSYLYLRAGDNTRSGTALNDHLADDDAGGDRNAQIQQTLVAGAYTIEATTYAAGETGDFTLTLSRLGPAAGSGPG